VKRKAFTLIELLVVIFIIGVLASLTLAALQNARESGRRTQCRSELMQFATAAEQFKAKRGDYPILSVGQNGRNFRMVTSYLDRNGNVLRDTNGQEWPEAGVLKTMFPSIDLGDTGLRIPSTAVPSGWAIVPEAMPEVLDPTQMFFLWTTGLHYTGYRGLSNNAKRPLTPPAFPEEARLEFLKVPSPVKFHDPGTMSEHTGRWHDPWGTAYVVHGGGSVIGAGTGYTYGPQRGTAPLTDPAGKTLHPRSFQIVSAGRDRAFGPGGTWVNYAGAGADDLVHFRVEPLGVPDR